MIKTKSLTYQSPKFLDPAFHASGTELKGKVGREVQCTWLGLPVECQIAVVRARHSCVITHLWEKAFKLSPLGVVLAMGFSQMLFIRLRKFPATCFASVFRFSQFPQSSYDPCVTYREIDDKCTLLRKTTFLNVNMTCTLWHIRKWMTNG